MSNTKVTVVTITFSKRWKFLSEVIESVVHDPYVVKIIVVDNGSENEEEIANGLAQYGDKIIILRQEKNLGSAGGFSTGIAKAREIDCDYVLLLDDDSVPEKNAIASYLNVLKFFPEQKVVLSGSRQNVLANKEYFYKRTILHDDPRGTFFEIFSLKKFLNFLHFLFVRHGSREKRGPFVPVIPTEGFVYGGSFIPIEAIRKAPLPDASLFLYGDDIEYSWGIKDLGYKTYLSASPRLTDIDLTFGSNSSHILGQFEKNTSLFRVYVRMRNMVRLSLKHSRQNKVMLFFNILIWTLGLAVLGLKKCGPTPFFFTRAKTIIQAVWYGYFRKDYIPENIRL